MEGKTKIFSRIAGVLNIAAAIFLAVTLVFFMTVGRFGLVTDTSEETDGTSESESTETEETGETQEEKAGKALGFAISLILFLPLILILLVPLGIVNFIEGLVFGSHCLKTPPKTGSVVFSLILKILTVPVFGFAVLLLVGLGDAGDSSIAALFPTLIAGYLVAVVVAHVFEWMANRSAQGDYSYGRDEFAR